MKKLKKPRATQGAEADTELVFQPMWVLKQKPSSAERFLNARFLETQISAHVGQAVPEGFADHFDDGFETPDARAWFGTLSAEDKSVCLQMIERVAQTRALLHQIDRHQDRLRPADLPDDIALADKRQAEKWEEYAPQHLSNVTVLLSFDNDRLTEQERVLAEAHAHRERSDKARRDASAGGHARHKPVLGILEWVLRCHDARENDPSCNLDKLANRRPLGPDGQPYRGSNGQVLSAKQLKRHRAAAGLTKSSNPEPGLRNRLEDAEVQRLQQQIEALRRATLDEDF